MWENSLRRLSTLGAVLLVAAATACSSSNNKTANVPTQAVTQAAAQTSTRTATSAPGAATAAVTGGSATGTAAAGAGTGGNVAVPASVVAADKALAAAAGSGSPIDQVTISKPVTLTFWHVSSDTSAAGKKLAALIQDFQAKNPNITINAQYISSNYSEVFQKVQTAITGGQTPDLVVAYENQVATYQTANVIVPLDDYIKSQKYGLPAADYSDIYQAYRYDSMFAAYGNKMLSFPWTKSVELMYYNADQLKDASVAVPETWDDFLKVAKAVTKGDTKAYSIGVDASRFVTGVYTRGGALLSDDQKKAVFNNQQGVDQLSMYQQMIKDGTAFQAAKAFDDENDLATGKATFNFSSSAGIPFYDKAVKDAGNKVHWNAALPPHGAGLPPATDMYGPNIAVFKSTPEKQLAAWLFVKYFTSKEVNPDWSVATGYLPVRASGLTDPRVQQQIATEPQYAIAVQAQQYGRPEPNVRQWDPVRAAINDAMVAAMVDPNKSAKQLLDDAVSKANAALGQ